MKRNLSPIIPKPIVCWKCKLGGGTLIKIDNGKYAHGQNSKSTEFCRNIISNGIMRKVKNETS
jgi:hypothetical protein